MSGQILSKSQTIAFLHHLQGEEKSQNTIQKYLRDIHTFARFAANKSVNKQTVINYKQYLLQNRYAPRSVNSMLASLNSLFAFLGWNDCRIKAVKLQRQTYCPRERTLTRAEYMRLCNAARQ